MNALNVYSHNAVVCNFPQTMGYEMKNMHIHDVYEIYMALSDQVQFFVNNGMYILQNRDIILFNKNDLHKVSVPSQKLYRRCIITFSPDAFSAQFRQAKSLLSCFHTENGGRHLKLTPDEQLRFLSLAKAIEQPENTPQNFSDIGRWLNLGQILLLLCGVQHRQFQERPFDETEKFPHVQRVLEYIDKNYTDTISLDALSVYCFVNKSYLCRLFKRQTGFHIHDYIVYRRLSQAISLLRSGKSVSDTAELSGFSSDTRFITVFRQQLGITPHQYAKNYEKSVMPD